MKTLNVIKIGGNIIDDDQKLNEFLQDFAHLKGAKLLVHGGGKTATRLADSLQLKTTMIDGRRITDDEMIDVVTMAYGGLVNKKIVSKLQSHEINALGLTGADGNLILSDKRPEKAGINYGWVGDPKSVRANWLKDLIENNFIPVIAPLTHDGKGNLLNTNADTIASVIASALSSRFQVYLNYCFELKGVMTDVMDEHSLVRDLTLKSYEEYKVEGIIRGGMIPKLDNAFETINKGTRAVRIMNYQSINHLQNVNYNEYTTIH